MKTQKKYVFIMGSIVLACLLPTWIYALLGVMKTMMGWGCVLDYNAV